jgi:hypothetical protein
MGLYRHNAAELAQGQNETDCLLDRAPPTSQRDAGSQHV